MKEDMLRALFVSKLKGKAEKWLNERPIFLRENVHSLGEILANYFEKKENRMDKRKRFENRKWKLTETFDSYYTAKVQLATGLTIDEEELVEYIIEGILDDSLRCYALINNYTTKAELYKSYHKVLQKQKESTATTGSTS